MKRLWSAMFVTALVVTPASVALAQPGPPAAAAAAAAAEVKAGTGVENKESVGTASEFAAGTKIWVWSRITGAAGAVKHVWKKDGTQVWAANLAVKSKRWTTSSRRLLNKAGAYTVEVVAADGTVLGSVAFTIK